MASSENEECQGPNTLVVFDGNSDTIQRFKVEADEWHSVAKGFTKEMKSWTFSAAAIGKALLIFLSNKAVYRFQRSTSGKSCWMRLPDSNFNHGQRPPVAVFQDNIYIVGCGGLGTHTSRVERFSLTKNEWVGVANLTLPRRNHSLAVTDDAIYAICGISSSGTLASVEKYTTSSKSWEKVATLTEARHSAAAVASADDIFIMGGFVRGNRTNDFFCISMPNADYMKLPKMKMTRTLFTAFIVDGKIFAVGGDNRQHDSVEAYDATRDQWDVMDILSTLRVEAALSMTIN